MNDVIILTLQDGHVDEDLMEGLSRLKDLVNPHEIGSGSTVTGQEAVKVATSFHEFL